MVTKRPPSSESNPLLKITASWVGFSAWKMTVLIIWQSPTSPKHLACRLALVVNRPNHCATADLEPVVSRSSGLLFIFFRFIACIHSSCECIKCSWSIHLRLFRLIQGLVIFSKSSSSKEKSNARLADVVYAKEILDIHCTAYTLLWLTMGA